MQDMLTTRKYSTCGCARTGFDALLRFLAMAVIWVMMLFTLPSSAADKAPVVVDVGLFLNNVPSVMLKERKFQVDFNVWFRWTGDTVNPLESFEVVGGHIDLKEELVKKKTGNVNYGLYKIVATINYNFDLAKYPLDDHALKIQIEDVKRDSSELVYRVDVANTKISPKVHVPGWETGHFEATTDTTHYPTNYGDPEATKATESNYSRFTFSLDLLRNGYGNFLKLFSMLFFAGGIAFFSFSVRSDYLDGRLALIVSGIFMAAITASMISSSLPESDSFDMAEKLYFATMAFIFATCLGSLHTFKIFLAGQEDRANLWSRRLGMALPIAYVIVNVLIVTLAHGEI
jgi:hypothetical protein